jgi:hypothetical protein
MREEAAKSAAAETADPWHLRLERVRGNIDFFDRLERVSSGWLARSDDSRGGLRHRSIGKDRRRTSQSPVAF